MLFFKLHHSLQQTLATTDLNHCIQGMEEDDGVLHTLNPAQNQFFHRNLENNIYKLHSNYKLLLKKHSQLCQQQQQGAVGTGLIGKHEEMQIETATRNIVRNLIPLLFLFSSLPFPFPCLLFLLLPLV